MIKSNAHRGKQGLKAICTSCNRDVSKRTTQAACNRVEVMARDVEERVVDAELLTEVDDADG